MKLDARVESLLRSLVTREGLRILELPYTTEFDRIFKDFQKASALGASQHQVWELLLLLDAKLGEERESTTNAVTPTQSFTAKRPSVSIHAPNAFPTTLFSDPVARSQQPWTVSREPEPPSEGELKRQRVLASIANSDFGTIHQKVAYILDRFPDTRSSDARLCIKYWQFHQADVLENAGNPDLGVIVELEKWISIIRERQVLQNELKLFRAPDEVALARLLGQKGFNEYLAARKGVGPEIRFYLDETGNEGDKRFTGVAGVAIMNWQQYEMFHAAIAQFRRNLGWAGAIHFSDTGQDSLGRVMRLLSEVQVRRSGLLFVGYAMPSQGRTHLDMLSLYVQLIVDSLKHMRANGCLDIARSLRVIKEADTGFDNIYLEAMTRHLADLTAMELPGLVVVQPVEAAPKGSDVFLECADLIAGGMQRRALSKGATARDRLAEAVSNVTGFENPADGGAVFKCYPSHP